MLKNAYVYIPKEIYLIIIRMNGYGYLLLIVFLPYLSQAQVDVAVLNTGYIENSETNLYVQLNVYLEGPFIGNQMQTDLNKSSLIPLTQPYSGAPWYYNGTESVTEMPNGNIVDWVLVELRNALTPDSATAQTVFGKQAALLLNSGKVVGLDGVSNLLFDTTFT
jgi:hypothetical protein